MEMRMLGNSRLVVAPLALGGNVFGWTADEQASHRILDEFVSLGFNLIDTADIYSRWAPGNQGGESEAILGRWFARSGKRDKVILATKVGMDMGQEKKGLSKRYMMQAVEASLQRLQTDYIDLYQAHSDDPGTPLEETLEAFSILIDQGKVRFIGASNYGAERLSQALQVSRQHRYPAYQSLQTLYNLYDRADYETTLEPLCRDQKLGVLCYFSLASGFLTGKYRVESDASKSARGDFVKKYLNERGFRILNALDHVAGNYGFKPATVALAWLMGRQGITAPIASATTVEQLRELAAAATLTLDSPSRELLEKATSPLQCSH